MKKESNSSSPAIKPMKFAPKIVPRKVEKAVIPKSEPVDTKNDVIDKELLLKLSSVKNEGPGRRMPNNDRKFAFGMGSDSTKARSFGKPKLGYDDDVYNASGSKKEKEYIEPWDYSHSYYPVTLPLRRPYMGDPETLDEEEFSENLASTTLDESLIDPTDELELLENRDEAQMLLFQFPKHLSVPEVSAADAKGKSVPRKEDNIEINGHNAAKGCTLKELPSGSMGKLLVYRSGAVKLKLGESLFDVSPGSDCGFAQEFAAIRTDMKQCCVLGEIRKRAIVTPDVDSLFGSIEHTGNS